jgi:hypothetical protein
MLAPHGCWKEESMSSEIGTRQLVLEMMSDVEPSQFVKSILKSPSLS